MISAPAPWVPPLPNYTRRAGNRPYLKIILILGTFDHLRKLHYYHSQLSVATLRHAAVGSRGIVGQIHEGQKDNTVRCQCSQKLKNKGPKKKKWSIADFLHTDSKNASENDGEVRFALILANRLRRNFLCPK